MLFSGMEDIRGKATGACRSVLVLSALVLASGTTHAFPATWEFKATVTDVPSTGFPADFTVGMPIRVLVSFDTEEPFNIQNSSNDPVTGLPRPGKRYRYFGVQSLQMAVYAGSSCAPCVPTRDPAYNPGTNSIFVRDDWQNEAVHGGPGAYDGYSFGLTSADNLNIGVVIRDIATNYTPQVVSVTGSPLKPLPATPDARLPSMVTSIFQACLDNGAGDCFVARIDEVSVPTYGTYFFLSGRHCGYPDLNTGSYFYGDDCIVGGGSQTLVTDIGGSAGQGDFSETVTHTFPSPTVPGATDTLGTVFGAASFGGPAGLPVLRGSSFPTAVGRTNSNLLAYQEYRFMGDQATPLQLVVDLSYDIVSNWPTGSATRPNGSTIDVGLRPGGATFVAVLGVVDGAKVPAESMAALRNFNTLECGAEAAVDTSNGQYFHRLPNGDPWPPGSILGAVAYVSPDSASGPQGAQLKVVRCPYPGETSPPNPMPPVMVNPGDRLYLTTSMQAPARGMGSQPVANGFVDAANTVRVTPDPAAPPEVLQQLAKGLEPACTDCEFTPEIAIDVKPGSADNSINIGSKGVIPVALLGSDRLNVRGVEISSLRFGKLSLRNGGGGKPLCSFADSNLDGLEDLVCQFQNDASNWAPGQNLATLTGELQNGELIFASDSIRLVP